MWGRLTALESTEDTLHTSPRQTADFMFGQGESVTVSGARLWKMPKARLVLMQ